MLMVGPPGAGKSMLAARLAGLLPPMNDDEALTSAAILSASSLGFTPEQWRRRPFRAPHHSASAAALVGGRNPPQPGEITLISASCFSTSCPNSTEKCWKPCVSRSKSARSRFRAPHSRRNFRRPASSSPR